MIRWFNEISLKDISAVGGKNASLGELYTNMSILGIKIPFGFAITTEAFDTFIEYNNLTTLIHTNIQILNQDFTLTNLKRIGMKIRNAILNGEFPDELKQSILMAYIQLSNNYLDTNGNPQTNTDVAVRSSGTAEDLPEASFAGQQETYLNVRTNNDLLLSIKRCFASLYTDRAISYRTTNIINCPIKLSVAIQKMVRSDLGSAGVAFSLDTESGFKDVIIINGAFGLGEFVVSGQTKPDEFIVYKPLLKNKENIPIIEKKMGEKTHKIVYGTNPGIKIEKIKLDSSYKNIFCMTNEYILELSNWIVKLEKYYSKLYGKWCPIDVEWAIDGLSGQLYIVQVRPETVISNSNTDIIREYSLDKHQTNSILLEGIAVGSQIATGKIRKLYSLDSRDSLCTSTTEFFTPGDILVTDMTDPDWEPIMKIASGIITNKGGRTCHASILARELGIPAIVGTLNATEVLKNETEVTVSCGEGEVGKVYEGIMNISMKEINLTQLPLVNTNILLNIASPEKTFKYHNYPVKGVGLVREEFIFNNYIKVHPLALLHHKTLGDDELTSKINTLIQGYASETDYFIKKLSYGISKIAATFYPHPVVVRFSDFKSNEYFNLLGGKYFEPKEENPMIGWRGASRYYSDTYKPAFGLECIAIQYIRDVIGLNNVIVMIPFCRTVKECRQVLETMKEFGLERGVNGLQVYLMCEVPSNVILAEQFLQHVDGYSIGSNDLTQLVLGLDRDSELVQHIYDERNEAVKYMITSVIKTCKRLGKKIGICGQGPSDYPEIAGYLVQQEIDSISITPDSIVNTLKIVADVEESQKQIFSNLYI